MSPETEKKDEGTEGAAAKAEQKGTSADVNRSHYGFRVSWPFLLVLLPPLVYYMWICMTWYDGAFVVPRSLDQLRELVSHVPRPTIAGALLYLGWFVFQALLQVMVPGRIVAGSPLPDGKRLPYRLNGWLSWWITIGGAFFAVWLGWISPTALCDHFGPMLTIAIIFSYAFSLYLYYQGEEQEGGKGSTGRWLYDYFMGTARNPRVGSFDWKFFCEARPGLILWVLINLSIAAKQYELHGAVTTPMMLVCLFHFLYIADYYFHEEAILSTWDIKHENFGWMLCFGDLVWVPFTYTLQAFYLLSHTHDLPVWTTLAIVALNLAGYYVFRTANLQKHRFRLDPERPIWGRKPEYIKTERGSLLLASGWWGMSRHANYMGDLMMALAWCLPCLFGRLLPYFYVIYFTILLVHRERRDNVLCAAKYGKDWEEYTTRVRWRIFPGIY